MTEVIHLPHGLVYNILLAALVLVLLWILFELLGAEFHGYLPEQLIAPVSS